MANLQDLPELPKSLSALLTLGNAQWKETERINQMRREIQEDISRAHLNGDVDNGRKWNQDVTKLSSANRMDAQITRLRREMVSLRQLDASLLCQLMSLNEAILDYKNTLHGERDRIPSETISEGSYPSFEQGLDKLLDFGDDGDLLECVFNAGQMSDSFIELNNKKQSLLNSPKHVRWQDGLTGKRSSQC